MSEPTNPETWQRLALAVVLQAVTDIRKAGPNAELARAWLVSDGLEWLDALEVNTPQDFARWVSDECKSGK